MTWKQLRNGCYRYIRYDIEIDHLAQYAIDRFTFPSSEKVRVIILLSYV